MEYELLKHRGLQPHDRMPSMRLLYHYSKYRKDREDAALSQNNGKVVRVG